MTMQRKPYQTYPEAFKLEALHMMEESDRPASETSSIKGVRALYEGLKGPRLVKPIPF